jgi:flagellar basal body P-ring protein FlgI
MKPKRSHLPMIFRTSLFFFIATVMVAGGCGQSSLLLSSVTDLEELVSQPAPKEETGPQLIDDVSRPWGVNYLKVESIALVHGLANTGSDPAPSSQRNVLLGKMRAHRTENPNQLLASPQTSMVLVQGYIPPGVRKGDRFDIEVRTRSRSTTKTLRSGWLMPTRLSQFAALGGRIREGHEVASAQGPVILDDAFDESDTSDEVTKKRGRVLGGGIATRSRPMGLIPTLGQRSVRMSHKIGLAINARFHTYDRGIQKGIATPKRDDFIELVLPHQYKRNVFRFVRVIGAIPLDESDAQRIERLSVLETELLDATTSARAAVHLEALGREGLPVLRKGIQSDNAEVRFHAAEAMAYLDDSAAAKPLARASQEPAFRWHALTALSVMSKMEAIDELVELLEDDSAENRFGAFRALRHGNNARRFTQGEIVANEFRLQAVDLPGEPMVHFAKTERPEVIVFGSKQRLTAPMILFGGSEIIVKDIDPDHVRVSRIAPGKPDKKIECSNRVVDVVRTIGEVGGGYDDVIRILQQARKKGSLASRIVIGAVPRPGRTYDRRQTSKVADAYRIEDAEEDAEPGSSTDSTSSALAEAVSSNDAEEKKTTQPTRTAQPNSGFFDRIFPWRWNAG